MNLLRRLASLFGGGGAPRSDKRYLTIYVLSRRCNEPISGQVDLLNELSRAEEGEYAYYTRKVLHTTGERRCFSQVEIQLYFNQDKQVVHHEVDGGRWLTSEEYSAELARFNAPPPEEEDDSEDGDREGSEGEQMAAEATPAASASLPTSSTAQVNQSPENKAPESKTEENKNA